MATIRIMYWKEIPVQVQATDEEKTTSVLLEERFQQAADSISMMDGSAGSEEYLMGWEWGKHMHIDGDAEATSYKLADKINSDMPHDFAARIRDMEISGTRKPYAGAIDHWMEE